MALNPANHLQQFEKKILYAVFKQRLVLNTGPDPVTIPCKGIVEVIFLYMFSGKPQDPNAAAWAAYYAQYYAQYGQQGQYGQQPQQPQQQVQQSQQQPSMSVLNLV